MEMLLMIVVGIVTAVLTVTQSIQAGLVTAGVVTVAAILHVLWTAWMDDDGLDALGSFVLGIVGIVMTWVGFGIGCAILWFLK
jgi:hypothetical protein